MPSDFHPSQLREQDLERLKGYHQMLDFYQGRQQPSLSRRTEKQLTFNYARVVVDKLSSYLMSGLHFTVEPLEDTAEARKKAKRAQAALDRVCFENNLEQLDFETEIDCAILGDFLLRARAVPPRGAALPSPGAI